ncbi:MAG TPA: FHA domain-containing protein, partial [Ktedonobacteraceae bacterium]
MELAQDLSNQATIKFLSGPLGGQIIRIQKPLIEIGRDGQNDIVILDPRVSRHHARIRLSHTTWTIECISPNGFITVNQQPMQQGTLQHESVVSLGGDTSFVFLLPATTLPSLPTEVLPSPTTPQPPSPTPAIRYPKNIPANASPTATVLASTTPSLIISSNVHSSQQVYALKREVQAFTIGRDPSSDIPIGERVVSALHAQIIRENGKLVLIHPHPAREKTLNGLLYQGRHISGSEHFRKMLVKGDVFRIGDEHGTLITLTYDDNDTPVPLEEISALPPIPLNVDRLTIGRAPDNTVILQHPQVSAHHAMLTKIDGAYQLIDTNSTNHVYINGDRVTNQILKTGDEIRIGPYRLTYTGTELRPYDESSNIRIDALHLKKVGNKNVILLNDISLVIPPRSFVALVGGSGAGKSTLMDALNGLRPAQEGSVLYNGMDYYRNLAAFSTQLGYVPQDDIVHRDLTVDRALYYAA